MRSGPTGSPAKRRARVNPASDSSPVCTATTRPYRLGTMMPTHRDALMPMRTMVTSYDELLRADTVLAAPTRRTLGAV